MKIERTERDERLIIQSDKDNIKVILVLMIPTMCFLIFSIVMVIGRAYELIPFGLIGTLLLFVDVLKTWIATSRTFIMSKEGCTVQFYHYHKHYQWEELDVRKYVNGSFQLEDFLQGFEQSYSEGVFFSKYRQKMFKWMKPYRYCVSIRPLSSFFVNFYSPGICEGHGDYKSQVEAYYRKNNGKESIFQPEEISRRPEVYAADKFEFLKYMDLWQVEIEGLSKIDRLLYAEEYDKR